MGLAISKIFLTGSAGNLKNSYPLITSICLFADKFRYSRFRLQSGVGQTGGNIIFIFRQFLKTEIINIQV